MSVYEFPILSTKIFWVRNRATHSITEKFSIKSGRKDFPLLVSFSRIYQVLVHMNTWLPLAAALILVHRELTVHPDVAPEQSLLPNSTDTTGPSPRLHPCLVWALPRTMPSAASSQVHVTGSQETESKRDERDWGKAWVSVSKPVRQDASDSEKIPNSKAQRFWKEGDRTIHREYHLTWGRAIPDSFAFLFLFRVSSLCTKSL